MLYKFWEVEPKAVIIFARTATRLEREAAIKK